MRYWDILHDAEIILSLLTARLLVLWKSGTRQQSRWRSPICMLLFTKSATVTDSTMQRGHAANCVRLSSLFQILILTFDTVNRDFRPGGLVRAWSRHITALSHINSGCRQNKHATTALHESYLCCQSHLSLVVNIPTSFSITGFRSGNGNNRLFLRQGPPPTATVWTERSSGEQRRDRLLLFDECRGPSWRGRGCWWWLGGGIPWGPPSSAGNPWGLQTNCGRQRASHERDTCELGCSLVAWRYGGEGRGRGAPDRRHGVGKSEGLLEMACQPCRGSRFDQLRGVSCRSIVSIPAGVYSTEGNLEVPLC